MRVPKLAVATLVALVAPARADLQQLITRVEAQSKLLTPLAADVALETSRPEGKTRDRGVLVVRNRGDGKPGNDVYLELVSTKRRLLVLGDREAHLLDAGRARKVGLDAALPGSAWTVEDFVPFSSARCLGLRIVDSRAGQTTFTCEPRKDSGSQYLLVVYKVDPERGVPEQVLAYAGTMSTLVKRTSASEIVGVGAKHRARRVVLHDYRSGITDTLTFEWRQDPKFPPELFDPRSFADPKLSAASGGSGAAEPAR